MKKWHTDIVGIGVRTEGVDILVEGTTAEGIIEMRVVGWLRHVLASRSRQELLVRYTQSDKLVTTMTIGVLILAGLAFGSAILIALVNTTI